MTGVAIGWVYEHSPFKGAVFSLHITIADTVDDKLVLYATLNHLAEKARLSKRSVQDGLDALVKAGMLTVLEPATNRFPAKYLVELPRDAPVLWILPGRRVANAATQKPGVQTAPSRVANPANQGGKPCTPSHISSSELKKQLSPVVETDGTLDLGVDNRPLKPRALAYKVFGDVNVARRDAGLTPFVGGEDAVTVTATFLTAGVAPSALLDAGVRCPTWTKRSVEMALNGGRKAPTGPAQWDNSLRDSDAGVGFVQREPGKSRKLTDDERRKVQGLDQSGVGHG